MELLRITSAADPLLERLFPLYEEAFPEAERRTRSQLTRMLSLTPAMHFTAILLAPDELPADSPALRTDSEEGPQGGSIVGGLFSYWDMGDFLYLEHLATFPHLRNHKIGGKALDYMKHSFARPQLLEVEPPADPLTRRRVAYYERNGFRVLNRDYIQPPYSHLIPEDSGLPLWIMGRGEVGNVEQMTETIRQRAYFEPYALE